MVGLIPCAVSRFCQSHGAATSGPYILCKPIRASTQPADVSAPSAHAHAPAAEASQSTELPAWQQNTSTDRAFYYFYLI